MSFCNRLYIKLIQILVLTWCRFRNIFTIFQLHHKW